MVYWCEICYRCKREQRIPWTVSDELWVEVMGEHPATVCLECFLAQADENKQEIKISQITILDPVFKWWDD